MSTNKPVSRTLKKLHENDGFDIKSPAGADPNSTWVVREFGIEDMSYRVAVEELPMDSGEKRFTLVIKRLDKDDSADVFRMFEIPDQTDAYQWLRDHMISILASKHDTLDGACAYVQDYLGVTDGGFAGDHFSDDDLARDFQNHETMKAYLLEEARYNEPDDAIGAMLMSAYEARRYAPGQQNELGQAPNTPKP